MQEINKRSASILNTEKIPTGNSDKNKRKIDPNSKNKSKEAY